MKIIKTLRDQRPNLKYILLVAPMGLGIYTSVALHPGISENLNQKNIFGNGHCIIFKSHLEELQTVSVLMPGLEESINFVKTRLFLSSTYSRLVRGGTKKLVFQHENYKNLRGHTLSMTAFFGLF